MKSFPRPGRARHVTRDGDKGRFGFLPEPLVPSVCTIKIGVKTYRMQLTKWHEGAALINLDNSAPAVNKSGVFAWDQRTGKIEYKKSESGLRSAVLKASAQPWPGHQLFADSRNVERALTTRRVS
jgi:hypothetical protein